MLLSRVYEESGLPDAAERAKGYLRRYLEDAPDAEAARAVWAQLSRLCHNTEDWAGEIHAIIELCTLLGTSIKEISNGLNRWNNLFKQQVLYIDGDERQILGRRLLELFEANLASASATDMSRAAWLYVAFHDVKRAEELVRQGLAMDSENEYCKKLASKLMLQDDLLG